MGNLFSRIKSPCESSHDEEDSSAPVVADDIVVQVQPESDASHKINQETVTGNDQEVVANGNSKPADQDSLFVNDEGSVYEVDAAGYAKESNNGTQIKQDVPEAEISEKLAAKPEDNLLEADSKLQSSENIPLPNIKDEIAEVITSFDDEAFQLENQAATKIQAQFKGHKARKEVEELKRRSNVPKETAVDSVAEVEPAGDSQDPSTTNDADYVLENQAATKIQAQFKGYKARKEVEELRKKSSLHHSPPAPVADSDRVIENSEILDDFSEAENQAATRIQAQFKGHKVRKEMQEVKEKAAADLLEMENHAATKIQAHFKGHLARKEINEIKEGIAAALEPEEPEKQGSLVEKDIGNPTPEEPELIIQASSESPSSIAIVDEINAFDEFTDEENLAATKIQAHFKGHLARKNLLELELDKNVIIESPSIENAAEFTDEENQAATKIQAHFKGHLARKNLLGPELDKEVVIESPSIENAAEFTDEENQAATKIQAHFKGHLARKNLLGPELDKEVVIESPSTENVEFTAEENQAATKIQAHYKGHLTRKNLSPSPSRSDQIIDAGNTFSHVMSEEKFPQNTKDIENTSESLMYEATLAEARNLDSENIEPKTAIFLLDAQDHASDVEVSKSFMMTTGPAGLQNDLLAGNAGGTDCKTDLASNCMDSGVGFEGQEFAALENLPEAEEAATKIQARYRGYKTRKNLQHGQHSSRHQTHNNKHRHNLHCEDDTSLDFEIEQAAVKIQAGMRGYLTRKRLKGGRVKSAGDGKRRVSLGAQDRAAAKIQAGVRGYMTRKRIRKEREVHSGGHQKRAAAGSQNDSGPMNSLNVDEASSNSRDAEELAAAKIQAGVRGHLTRKRLKQQRQHQRKSHGAVSSVDCIDGTTDDDFESRHAATKIQAQIRGYLTRKQLKALATEAESDQLAKDPSNNNEKDLLIADDGDFHSGNSSAVVDGNRKPMREASIIRGTPVYLAFFCLSFARGLSSLLLPVLVQNKLVASAACRMHAKQPPSASPLSSSTSSSFCTDDADDSEAVDVDVDFYVSFRVTMTAAVTKRRPTPAFHRPTGTVGTDADADTAATKIQSRYRGYQTRKRVSEQQRQHRQAATKIQAHYRGYRTRKNMLNKDQASEPVSSNVDDVERTPDPVEINTDDGRLTGATMPREDSGQQFDQAINERTSSPVASDANTGVVDVDTDQGNDEEAAAAAIKIQSHYRGFKTRKELSNNSATPIIEAPETSADGNSA
ncbi:unnamed protein product [Notodromas monacha]|uniref:Abnormal spindle-like microcephaly-associated protein n=1 Tax=Notodromas monacha TaxID=399045 RepID=A0A7R9BWR8_9CRUS|nr:unnamed protein product [Notodromas monacha]CAG0923202.1 unnamed protein product [Notodromas monacha]